MRSWRLACLACVLALNGCFRPGANSKDLDAARVTRDEPNRNYRRTTEGEATRPSNDREQPYEQTSVRRDESRNESASNSNLIYVWFSDVWQAPANNKTNPRSIAAACVQVIDSARRTLDVCVFEIDNELIVPAILAAHRRGVRVRVVTENDYLDELGPREFRRAGIEVLPDNRTDLMHNKFMVIDDRMVWTGSYNFTENCAYKNNNNGILFIDEKIAANYAEKFRWFWDYRKFGGRPSKDAEIPYPVVRMADGTTVENYFSTHDQIDRRVIELIGKAKRSIVFMAFSFTHGGIAQAMIDAAKRGVQVAGVVETRQNSEHSEFAKLRRTQGVEVLLDGNSFNMHHKVIVLDDQVVITGSYNFSASATKGNDENIVFVYNRAVAARYNDEFRRVYGQAARALTARPDSSIAR